jgi:hypothetical protein
MPTASNCLAPPDVASSHVLQTNLPRTVDAERGVSHVGRGNDLLAGIDQPIETHGVTIINQILRFTAGFSPETSQGTQ